jgi:hypothetical protein
MSGLPKSERTVLTFFHLLQEAMHSQGGLPAATEEEGGREPQDLLPHEGYRFPASVLHDPLIEKFRYLLLWQIFLPCGSILYNYGRSCYRRE